MDDEDLLLEDLSDLRAAIEQALFASAASDKDGVNQAIADALGQIETLAVLHCDINIKAVTSYRDMLCKGGLRIITVPVGFSGNWFIFPEAQQ